MFSTSGTTTLANSTVYGNSSYGVITNGIDHGGVWHVLTGDGAMSALLGPITLGYKGGVGDHLGFTMLMGFAVTCAAMGFTTSAFRDGDPEAVAEVSRLDAAPAVTAPADLSPWPIVASWHVIWRCCVCICAMRCHALPPAARPMCPICGGWLASTMPSSRRASRVPAPSVIE